MSEQVQQLEAELKDMSLELVRTQRQLNNVEQERLGFAQSILQLLPESVREDIKTTEDLTEQVKLALSPKTKEPQTDNEEL